MLDVKSKCEACGQRPILMKGLCILCASYVYGLKGEKGQQERRKKLMERYKKKVNEE